MFISDTNAVEFGGHLETPAERELYNYVRELAHQPSEIAIRDYYRLLFEGTADTHPVVQQALAALLASPKLPQVGNFVINRCFHTVGNRWMQEKDRQGALHELVTRLSTDMPDQAASPTLHRLHQVLRSYLSSDLYGALKWQMCLRPPNEGAAGAIVDALAAEKQPLRDDFGRFFFIHEAMTTTPDIPRAQRHGIRHVQSEQARAFNHRLCAFADRERAPSKKIIPNPTTFPDREATQLIHTYRPDRPESLLATATAFQGDVRGLKLGELREELQRFVLEPLAAVDSRLSPTHPGWIQNELRSRLMSGEADTVGFNPVSVMTLCKRLLQFLVVESVARPSASYFKKLTKRVGHCAFTQAVLRIVLFWPQARFFLGERFSILFKTYQDFLKGDEQVIWLVQSLEHLNMGLTLNGRHLHYFSHAR